MRPGWTGSNFAGILVPVREPHACSLLHSSALPQVLVYVDGIRVAEGQTSSEVAAPQLQRMCQSGSAPLLAGWAVQLPPLPLGKHEVRSGLGWGEGIYVVGCAIVGVESRGAVRVHVHAGGRAGWVYAGGVCRGARAAPNTLGWCSTLCRGCAPGAHQTTA